MRYKYRGGHRGGRVIKKTPPRETGKQKHFWKRRLPLFSGISPSPGGALDSGAPAPRQEPVI